jgi:glycosyltransferase involved in cell wall biosynthesis/thiamine kinase-like enzyme
MKILMSALACEPGKGSELEVGFRALLAAASRHEVWLLTNSATIPIVRRAIQEYPWSDRVHFEGIYFDVDDELYPQLTAPGFHRYYDRWQRKAAVRAVELAERIDFDVVHHVTLAASWTRAGVTAVDKPLVWGPVGGGVEPPLSLLADLGWRGLLDETGRVAARRLLMRIGPARLTQQRALVTFAQNAATARVIRTHGRMSVLSNATAVDIRDVQATGGRRCDVVFAARLLPWKGGRLAVRTMQYVRHPEAVLRIFGDGPERRRIARAARRWGVAHRVRFEGRVQRDELLRTVATAGVFFHTAFHDEAGLAVAEALSLGTPVVCLDRGGPPELLHHWPTACADAVAPDSPEQTAKALAAAIDRCLSNPPAVSENPQRSNISFEHELLAAYELAFAAGRDSADRPTMVWAFPGSKPQVFADTPRELSKGVMVYGFGRRLPRWTQRALALQVRVPILRRLLAEPTVGPAPVCGWVTWRAIREEVCRRNGQSSLEWIHFQSQWGKQRSSMLGLDRMGTPSCFVVIEPNKRDDFRSRVASTGSFRVAACVDSFVYEAWSVRQYEPLPRFHRPASWNPARIRRVAQDVSVALTGVLAPAVGTPSHWRPIHGDYVPWNLREDDRGQLWLLDWEDARWGPPSADLVRYIVAYHSLGWSSADRIATIVKRTVGEQSIPLLLEVAKFWLSHENLQPSEDQGTLTRGKAKDTARAAREVAAFHVLASAS